MRFAGPAISLRAFDAGDYAALSGIRNAIYGASYSTPASIYQEDQGGHGYRRWMSIIDGGAAAASVCFRPSPLGEEERVFDINIETHPNYRYRGVGTKLYQFLQAQLASLNPSLIQSCVREDQSDGIRFLKSQGFHEAMSTWEAVLDISNADIPKTQEDETRLKARGIEIKTIVELGSDPDWDSKLFDLFSILISDIPMMMKRPRLTREYFERCILGNEAMLPEAFFVAVAGGIYVGMTNLFREPQPDALGTRQTGVLREFRRQGIASALKKRGLRFAREHGYRVVKTHNASDNLPIVKLNERLDFAKRLSWITYRREV